MNLYNKSMSPPMDLDTAIAMKDLDFIVHFLPYDERRVYDKLMNGGPYDLEFDEQVCGLMKWDALGSGLLCKHIIKNSLFHITSEFKHSLIRYARFIGNFDLVEYLLKEDDYFYDRCDFMRSLSVDSHLSTAEIYLHEFNFTLDDISFQDVDMACPATSGIKLALEKYNTSLEFIVENIILNIACQDGIFNDNDHLMEKYDWITKAHHVRGDCTYEVVVFYKNVRINIMKHAVDKLFTSFNAHAKDVFKWMLYFQNLQLIEHIINKFNLSTTDIRMCEQIKTTGAPEARC
jgi:hypothetical protein